MPEALLGVRIDGGLVPFRIIQQNEAGVARLSIHGRWGSPENCGTVQLRIVRESDGTVVVPWQSSSHQDDGSWNHASEGVPAGGLYRLESRLVVDPAAPEWGLHGDVIHHFGVGDLWIIGGQSNAAGYGRGPVHDPPELGVHLLRNDETWSIASHPLNDTTGSTHPNLEAANPGHSPYLRFASDLKAALGYPIGLIETALGGSSLAAWNPEENPDAPLYRNLIRCVNLAGGRVRGLVWYQGESDCAPSLAATYERRFGEFIQRLRHDLDAPALPVIIAQLNRYTAAMSVEDHRGWSLLREAQRQAIKLGHVAVVPTLDLTLSDAIHTSPDGNLILGSRKARAALALVYGKSVPCQAPSPTAAVLDEDGRTIELAFTDVPNRLAFLGPGEGDFTVEDETGFVPVQSASTPASNRVRLALDRPAVGQIWVHGAFGANPPCQLRDAEENIPMLGFYRLPVMLRDS